MNFIVIFGPSTVGRMTVDYELANRTGMKVFHNHMIIDLVPFFSYGDEKFDILVAEFRRRIFQEVASSDLPGLIFTDIWALDQPRDLSLSEQNLLRMDGQYRINPEGDFFHRENYIKIDNTQLRVPQVCWTRGREHSHHS